MKSVRIAIILLILILIFSLSESFLVTAHLKRMFRSAAALPSEPYVYETDHESYKESIEALRRLWEKGFPYLTYVSGYSALNRADEAVVTLCVAYDCKNYDDSILARAQLLDALRRLLELERVSLSSVF